VINISFSDSKKSPTWDMTIVPSRASGPVFPSEADFIPGAAANERLMASPFRVGVFLVSPIKSLRDRTRLTVLGPSDVLTFISAAPPSITTPSILAEQEKNPAKKGKNNKKK
jgi:hypothetical protein